MTNREWTPNTDTAERRIEVYSGPDRDGNYHYAMFWWADYHPGHPKGEHGWRERGQHFLGNPDVHGKIPQVDLR